jgi:hypothetical protein
MFYTRELSDFSLGRQLSQWPKSGEHGGRGSVFGDDERMIGVSGLAKDLCVPEVEITNAPGQTP